jgi:hypothetical protein
MGTCYWNQASSSGIRSIKFPPTSFAWSTLPPGEMGTIHLRIGDTAHLRLYAGHVGYFGAAATGEIVVIFGGSNYAVIPSGLGQF